MVNKELFAALDQLEKDKGISKEILFEALEVALVSAYKRNFQASPNVRVNIDRDTGEIKVFSQLKVVEEVENPQQEINLYEARVYEPRCQINEHLEMEVTPKEFGRIAAQTAKQVVIQRIREAERELIYETFSDRVEDIVNGQVQRFEQRNAIIDLGKVEAVLPVEEQIPHERYRQGERIKAFIMEVKKTSKGPQVIVSRTKSGFLKRLFEKEVPEIYEGIVEIKAAAREPGNRSKIAVWSSHEDIDPVGACVGPRGTRVQTISNELKGERIDIIMWSEKDEEFISSALSPAKVSSVELNSEEKTATVVVPDSQLSLAIGKEGQNARLAARLTGWKIDICNETQYAELRLSSLGLNSNGVEKEEELEKNEEHHEEPNDESVKEESISFTAEPDLNVQRNKEDNAAKEEFNGELTDEEEADGADEKAP